MAQTNFTPISLYYSTTAAAVPTAGNLVAGELAINTTDGRLYYKDTAGVVQILAGKGGSGVAGGSNTQVQYNSSGSLAGDADFTFNGTTVTMANDASISGLTVGKGGGAVSTNTVVGNGAQTATNTGGFSNAFGQNALAASTSGGANNAFGWYALTSTTSGGNNSAFGHASLNANTTGANNVGVGSGSLNSNTTASNNTAVGYQAGYSNTTGTNSVYIGIGAGRSVTTSSDNCMAGYYAGESTTGGGNTFFGKLAGNAVTSGTKNTILGSYTGNQGGLDIRTSSNHIVLSDGDGNPRLYITGSGNVNQLFCPAVYDWTTANSANVVVTGTSGHLVRSTSALKYKQDIRDLEPIDINKFRPVRYKSKSASDDQTKDYFGFIADEVDEAGVKELVQYGSEGEVEGFSYDRMTAVLVKAVQDLKKTVEAQALEIATLKGN